MTTRRTELSPKTGPSSTLRAKVRVRLGGILFVHDGVDDCAGNGNGNGDGNGRGRGSYTSHGLLNHFRNPSMPAAASKLQRDAGRAASTRIRMEIEGGLLAI